MTYKVAVLPGDGIGPEVVEQAVRVLNALKGDGLSIEFEQGLIGGVAYRQTGDPLPKSTIDLCRAADAILFGAVGDFSLDTLPRHLRPDRGGILRLRQELELFANLRPLFLFPQLIDASPVKADVIRGLDVMIVRELSSDIYFSQPSGFRTVDQGRWVGQREGYDTMRYNEGEVKRIVEYAFDLAAKRQKKVCSVDKSNVLEASQVWRDVATSVASHHPEIAFSCMYADNSAMQLVRAPTQFDVIVTGNLFGDILSDLGSVVAGSIGMLPSASLADAHYGLYEPIHGSAPDLAGQNKANPLGTILSAAMMLDISFGQSAFARRIEKAVSAVLDQGLRTGDIFSPGMTLVGTREMGDAVMDSLLRQG